MTVGTEVRDARIAAILADDRIRRDVELAYRLADIVEELGEAGFEFAARDADAARLQLMRSIAARHGKRACPPRSTHPGFADG